MNAKRKLMLVSTALLLAVAVFATSTSSFAQSYDPDQDIPKPTILQKRVHKLGRGLTNVLFSITEIPVTWHNKMIQGKPLTYLMVTAPIIGTTRMFMRAGIGVYELFTFWRENPAGDFEAMLEPEYIF